MYSNYSKRVGKLTINSIYFGGGRGRFVVGMVYFSTSPRASILIFPVYSDFFSEVDTIVIIVKTVLKLTMKSTNIFE